MRRLCTAVVVSFLASCASTPSSTTKPSLVATDREGGVVYRGAASWTVRATSASREDVVAIPGLGEVIAVDERRCRLVRAENRGGVLGMTVFEATTVPRCLEIKGDKVCFTQPTTFASEGAAYTVEGCADRNDIFLSRVDGMVPASVGPKAFVERCAPFESKRVNYVRVTDIAVEHNDRPRHGVRFRASGEEFEVCFLVKERGRYRVVLDVEDPVSREVVLEGEVDEL